MDQNNAGSDVAAVAAINRVLSDATRLKLLLALGRGERTVTELLGRLGLGQSTVSHHLGILRRAGIIKTRREGKFVYYRLSSAPPAPGTIHVLVEHASVTVNAR